ncbi:MAG: tetratricopeptide repeat protein [Anaerolineae bacterium]
MPQHPSGTVTFLFTEIDGIAQLWEQHPEAMKVAVPQHDDILRNAVEAHAGYVVKTTGVGLLAAFGVAENALAAALMAEHALASATWGETGPLRVRMALHTGPAEERDGDYFGPTLNRAARLMAVGHGGQILLSMPTYELVRDHLPETVTLRDLGEQRLKDLARPEHVYQVVTADLPADFPALRTLDARSNNLPTQPTVFVGRETELADLKRMLLQDGIRLVTLTGPGGTGKTRLALQVAANLLDRFADGVCFVDFAGIMNTHLVASTIAQALGVRDQGTSSLVDMLKDYLQGKQTLLLLDNLEQVVSEAPLVAELLDAAPRLKVLATSRIVLRLRGEREFRVLPLPAPDPRHLPPLSTLAQYAAVQLFVQRAVSVKPDFKVTRENAAAVAQICYRLDGLPLAIELAAARIRVLPPEALLQRLNNRFKLLTGGPRDLPARQQTLRGAIAWSYDLLDEHEKTLFRRLGVFVGGWTVEAAEAVCPDETWARSGKATPSSLRAEDVLDALESLVAKSLIRQEPAHDEPRFSMLETIREYALERLTESGETEIVHEAHMRYYLGQLEAMPVRPAARARWLEGFRVEMDNGRAALRSAVERNAAEPALHLVKALWPVWNAEGQVSEARTNAEIVLDMPGARDTRLQAIRAEVLARAAVIAAFQNDYASTETLSDESMTIFQALGDKAGMVSAYYSRISAAWMQGDYAGAEVFVTDALALARDVGDRWLISQLVGSLGTIARERGDYDVARAHFEEALALRRTLNDDEALGDALMNLGATAAFQGDQKAEPLLQDAMKIFERLGHKYGRARTLHDLGFLAAAHGAYELAGARFAQSLVLFHELGDRRNEAKCLEGLAGVAAALHDPERSARLLGAAESLRDKMESPLPPSYRAAYERTVASVRKELDTNALGQAWAAGKVMTLEAAVAYALAEAPRDAEETPSPGSNAPGRPGAD